MADLPIAPGEVYIEVEYDYEYKAKNRVITIHQGECYMLVKKTNEDWWQVRKEEGSKAFYVPAQYVREVRKALMPPPKPLPHPPAASGNPPPHNASAVKGKPTSLDLGLQNQPAENLHRQESSYRRSPSAQTAATDRFSPPIHRRDSNNHRTPSSPTDHDRALAEGPHPDARGKSSTLPRARARSPELVRAPLDVDSTQGCDSAGEERRTNDSESGDEMSSSSTEQLQWLKHVDEQGRPYYYSADGSRSEWELPKVRIKGYNHSPPQLSGDAPKTRSLDRRQVEPIVLTKWRHSTFVSEPGDKRLLKTRCFRPGSARPHSFKHQQDAPQPPSPDSDSCPSSPPTSPSQKCGLLNMTKITEHGKKVRKNWTSSWTVLQGSALLFTKSQGGGTSWFGASQSKPEFTVDLRGGAVEWASKDKSSKKHVLELKTRQGTELLIQSDNDGVINEWFRALQDSISTHAWESDEAIEEDMPESPVEKHDKDKEHRDSKKNRAMKSSTSMDSSDNKKTRHKLKKFLTRRPTLQAVRDKGYIKDQVFGCSLSDLCHRESATVPAFVKMCIDHVENSCLCVDGLYRVSGNLAVIQKLRYAVDHDEKVNLQDGKWEDIHVTTGALKMYFRELPEPLFTYALFHDFVSAIKITDYKHRVQAIKDLVKQLPRPNHDTMQALFKHLRKVIDHGEENRMTTQSVAIVFGPTLLRPETETFNMAVHMVYPNQIVELILHEYENIFGR
ncbi:rho GTPase-activating protein 12-like isoform X16 [Takifugu flavidus]|uniref:rho GTPase-activating protein 12-like isoform X16 n=1 Tax=Takifugu flavidus TaxID=433684 RepID=UPI00254474FF|nr:rho GTPase-activating protein 12-like isoform X16 [Takifugu flavidus]